MTLKELFDFVTDISITADNLDSYLDQAMQISSERTIEDVTQQDKIDEAVIKLSALLIMCCEYCNHWFNHAKFFLNIESRHSFYDVHSFVQSRKVQVREL